MKIYSAPLQGFTEAVWRNLHNRVFGGIDGYFTPFLRFEHGEIRNKDIRDVERKNNTPHNLVPQIIVADVTEMAPLLSLIRQEGYKRVDINMGCPFPLQARRGRGAGILPYPEAVAGIMDEVKRNSDLSFSLKMRLGWQDSNEWKALLPVINSTPLLHVTMHPRIGVQQYKGGVDLELFRAFYNECTHPVVYNGDLLTLQDIMHIQELFPELDGVMLGRGLLANPALGIEYRNGAEIAGKELAVLIRKMHDEKYDVMVHRLQGNTQFLSKLKPYWEYLLPGMSKRNKKAILKANTVEKYMHAVNNGLAEYE